MATLKLDVEWRTAVFTAVLLPVFVSLGFWQLERADEKEALATAFEQRSAAPPQVVSSTLMEGDPELLAYLPVVAEGQFLPERHILLDNRIQGGRYGYEVVSVMSLPTNQLLLVNRGWIAGDPARRALPDIPELTGPVTVSGHVYVAPGDPYLLAEQDLSGQWPLRLQALEMDKLSVALTERLGASLLPYPLRIDAGEPGSLAVDWQVVNVSPAKHLGYAVQWFTMAAALLLLFIFRSSNLWQLLRGRNE